MSSAEELEEALGFTTPKTRTPQDEIDELAEQLVALREQAATIKDKIGAIEDEIWNRTPQEPGEFAIEGEQYSFNIACNETWSWNSDVIESLIPTVPIPEFVKAKYSIDKKLYTALPATDQAEFAPALTRKPAAPRIKVAKKPTK